MDKITIQDLEVFYRVGVPDDERAKPQQLLLTVEMEHDFVKAAQTDDLNLTINYFAVSQRLLQFGENRNWKLIETLAAEIADMILWEFHPASVNVEIKKFIIPQAKFVSVKIVRP